MCRQLQGPCLLRRIQPENRAYILPGLRTAMHPSANSPFRLAFRIRGQGPATSKDHALIRQKRLSRGLLQRAIALTVHPAVSIQAPAMAFSPESPKPSRRRLMPGERRGTRISQRYSVLVGVTRHGAVIALPLKGNLQHAAPRILLLESRRSRSLRLRIGRRRPALQVDPPGPAADSHCPLHWCTWPRGCTAFEGALPGNLWAEGQA